MDSDAVAMHGAAALVRRSSLRGAWPDPARHSPVRDRRRRPIAAWIVAGAAALMLLDGAASLWLPVSAAPPPPAPAEPVVGVWRDIASPFELYALSGSAFARLPLVYAAQRKGDDERLDRLTYGTFGEAGAFLQLAVHRLGRDPPASADLLVDLARLAATDGLAVTRMGLPLNLMTRFGLFDTADITVQHGARIQPCLGFRLSAGEAGVLAMAGLACGSDGKPLDRGVLGCVLSRIDIVSAGDDQALRDVFVAAERRRTDECNALHRRGSEAP